MTLCPIAIVASCKQCPMFKICPAKGILGDYKPETAEAEASGEDASAKEAASEAEKPE